MDYSEKELRAIFSVITEKCSSHVWYATEVKELSLAIQLRIAELRKDENQSEDILQQTTKGMWVAFGQFCTALQLDIDKAKILRSQVDNQGWKSPGNMPELGERVLVKFTQIEGGHPNYEVDTVLATPSGMRYFSMTGYEDITILGWKYTENI